MAELEVEFEQYLHDLLHWLITKQCILSIRVIDVCEYFGHDIYNYEITLMSIWVIVLQTMLDKQCVAISTSLHKTSASLLRYKIR